MIENQTQRRSQLVTFATVFALATIIMSGQLIPGSANAQSPVSELPALAVELNKLETYEKGCRAYVVVTNSAEQPYQTVKLDLVVFQPDGVIARRFALDLAPLKAAKKTVKLFDIEGLACEKIASVLINDVMDCKSDTGALPDCLARIKVSSVAAATLSK